MNIIFYAYNSNPDYLNSSWIIINKKGEEAIKARNKCLNLEDLSFSKNCKIIAGFKIK